MMLVFALAAPSFAADGDDASYVQNSIANSPDFSATGAGTVYLTILSNSVNGNYIARFNEAISIESNDHAHDYCTVYEVLVEAHNDIPDLIFTIQSSTIPTGTSNAVVGVKDNSVSNSITFGPVLSYDYYNGWMFRINNQFPLLNQADWPSGWTASDGPIGASIEQAYVTNGQTITLYCADMKNSLRGTHYLMVDDCVRNGNTLVLNLSASQSYYDASNSYYWVIDDFALVDDSVYSFTVMVNGDYKFAYYSSDGVFTISGVTDTSGTVTIIPTFNNHTSGGIAYGIPKITGATVEF